MIAEDNDQRGRRLTAKVFDESRDLPICYGERVYVFLQFGARFRGAGSATSRPL